MATSPPDVDIDLREVYFLIMHFLSAGPCKRTYGQFWNELLEHQLLPRRYHAWYSRRGTPCGDEDDDGKSLPLGYLKLVERYPHIEKGHLVNLLKQLILSSSHLHGINEGGALDAVDIPTLLGSGPFSLLGSDRDREGKRNSRFPGYLRWPHMQADQVRGLSLREIGGGFTKHHRAPSVRAACYAIAKPATMVQKMQIIKKMRGHQNAVYCAIFDRSGRYVITGSDDRLVKIWSMETAFCLASCRGHEGDITDLAVSSNNALVASSSNDFIIRVWRLPDGFPISVLRGHTGVVTAIAFSPRQSAVYQLLSSSDDGTCRIWDARNSGHGPRIYSPRPPEAVAGKINDPSPSIMQPSRQILCCAFNANGTVFVTGSSDTYARVWNAYKVNSEDSEQPNHEIDQLSGHENDVNYVQFSGCAVASRSSATDTSKEDNLPKFKNSWFSHDNIVTCSRDGSAIIWIPRSRRSHGKVGRWARAYHLKVPPPPMLPQPPRGGPRQRFQPTPRGVNMIVWSLDNRFVLAAIMDCRICVWNASDGSLVHSLIGHTESTFVLDVHPFNPRIAMSAGYDGKTIIWDIWEGIPVRTYETGHFKLVDGKFSPDGTSIVLSDEVGQMFIIATGQGESQKDAKYDQFFLGDYRPLIQDTAGNVVDQESQLVPYRRNMQDLLCDSGMIPYPEAYQNIYQQRRLGTLGHEWRPPSIKFAVGPTFNPNTGDYQMLPIVDLDRWVEPLPQIVDAIDWEPEIEVQSDDTDSEYNALDESSSDPEHVSLSSGSNGNPEGSGEDILVDHDKLDGLRRSKRKKHKSKAEFTTSSGRRVKRRNWDERDGITSSRGHKIQRPRNGGVASRKKSTSKSSRPRRLAAQNARNLLSRINGVSTDEEDEDDSESCSSESELSAQSDEFEGSKKNVVKHVREIEASRYECEGALPPQQTETETNTGTRRRLILKFPIRDRKPIIVAKTARPESHEQDSIIEAQVEVGPSQSSMDIKIRETTDNEKNQDQPNAVYKGNNMMWGEVKTRSTKRLRLGDASLMDGPIIAVSDVNSHPKSKEEFGASLNSGIIADGDYFDKKGYKNKDGALDSLNVTRIKDKSPEHMCIDHSNIDETLNGFHVENDNENPLPSTSIKNNGNQSRSIYPKLRIKSNVLVKGTSGSSSKLKSVAVEDSTTFESKAEQNLDSSIREEDEGTSSQSPDHSDWNVNSSISHDSNKHLDFSGKKYNAVYRRSKLSRGRNNPEGDVHGVEQNTSDVYNNYGNTNMGYSYVMADGGRRTRSMGIRASTDELNSTVSNSRVIEGSGSLVASRSGGNFNLTGNDKLLFEDWKPTTRMAVGLRSSRNRRESYSASARSVDQRKHNQPARKLSWLMLSEQEEGCRYIPQQGDEVAYLRQGHEECAELSQETGTRRLFNGSLKDVEFCRIRGVEYSTYRGSGESCCKLTLEFIDSSSIGFGKVFKLTLPELVSSPDFLVERTRYIASIERNWTHRDRCKVWWRNEDGEGGSWYDGRILQVKPKSPEYPESPWERYLIKYKDPPFDEHSHSPWELRDPDSRWEHPCIDQRARDKLLSCLNKIERTSARKKDDYGIDKLNQVAQKSEFLNRFPVPLSLEVIKRRLENNYYRSLEAIKHDAFVVVSNAESYFSRNTDMSKKMRRLSEWIAEIFESQ